MMTATDVVLASKAKLDQLSPTARKAFESYYVKCFRDDPEKWLARNESNFTEIYDLLGDGPAPMDVLDVGCGCGTEALTFASFGHRVLAIDLNQKRLAAARERAGHFDPPRPEFLHSDVFNVEGTFDLIWMNQAYHHIEPRPKLGPKLWDLLKPGGHVVIAEANGTNLLNQLVLFRFRGFKTIAYRTDEKGQRIPYGNERITTATAITKRMREAGLEPVSRRYHRVLPNQARFAPAERRLAALPLPGFAHSHFVLVLRKP